MAKKQETVASVKAQHAKELKELKTAHSEELKNLKDQLTAMEKGTVEKNQHSEAIINDQKKQIQKLTKEKAALEANQVTADKLAELKEEAKKEILIEIQQATEEENKKIQEEAEKAEAAKTSGPFIPEQQIDVKGDLYIIVNNPGGPYGAFTEESVKVQESLFKAQRISTKTVKIPKAKLKPNFEDYDLLLYRAVTQTLPHNVSVKGPAEKEED